MTKNLKRKDAIKIYSAKIINFDNSRGDSPTILIGNKKFVCFFPRFSQYGWNKLDNENKLDKLFGEKIAIYLVLNVFDYKDIKTIKIYDPYLIPVSKGDIHYEASGKTKLVDNKLMLDCGLKIYLNSPNKLHSGDLVQVKGRLDAYLVNKEENNGVN
ncbi:MAG TPA: hypothetical protein VJG83_02910 [archaeon]|nr:hypothetical protein [archaeon]